MFKDINYGSRSNQIDDLVPSYNNLAAVGYLIDNLPPTHDEVIALLASYTGCFGFLPVWCSAEDHNIGKQLPRLLSSVIREPPPCHVRELSGRGITVPATMSDFQQTANTGQ